MKTNIKVLFGDNTQQLGKPCSNILKENGLDVTMVAKDGREVLRAIELIMPDYVIMHLFMPFLDALAVINSVKNSNLSKVPQFWIMSNVDSAELERKALLGGADYYVIIPFDANALSTQIKVMHSGMSKFKNNKTNTNNIANNFANSNQDLEIVITEILHQIGVPAHIKGYRFLRDGISLAVKDPTIMNAVTKRLYPEIAELNSTTSSRVERAIRHAIEIAWNRGSINAINDYFGYTVSNTRGKPTNSEFIAMISDHIRLKS